MFEDDKRAWEPLGRALEMLRRTWAVDHATQHLSRAMAATLGLTGPQRLVLRVIGKRPAISASELSDFLHLDASTMTPFVQRVDVRAGVVAELPVVAAPGAPVTVRVPGTDVPFGFLRVTGALTLGVGVDPRAELVRGFAPGGYELELDDLRGNRFGAAFTIGADLAPRTVTLTPRR